ncbi:MAG: TOBE domain-containing protein, partial [Anaerolineae bacterium]|nr:TOBE domain-containing protein [Anaerolineae bacterium]
TRIVVLNAGRLQQIDSPFNLYHNPYNVFVAGFIGSPSMNFFDAKLLPGEGEALIVDTGVFQINVPPSRAEPYRSHVGKEVILGVRPEDIHDANYLPPGITPARIEANVEVIEQMGHEMIIYLEEGGKNFIARTDPRTQSTVGSRMGVVMNLDNMHVFDRDTELSLAYDYKNENMSHATT